MKGLPIRKMGEVLLEAGLITPAQLEKALVAREGQEKKLGKILIELGYLNEAQIAEALFCLIQGLQVGVQRHQGDDIVH